MRSTTDSTKFLRASQLRTIFASSARENEHVYVHNLRDFPQAKLDNEINVRFLLDKHRKVPFSTFKLVYNSLPFH